MFAQFEYIRRARHLSRGVGVLGPHDDMGARYGDGKAEMVIIFKAFRGKRRKFDPLGFGVGRREARQRNGDRYIRIVIFRILILPV